MRFSATGEHLWTVQYDGGGSQDSCGDVMIDPRDGATVVAGSTTGSMIGGQNNNRDANFFVTKISAGGDVLWTKEFGKTAGYERLYAVAYSASDGTYVVGGYKDNTGVFPGQSNAGGDDLVFGKLNREGDVLWLLSYGGPGNDYVEALVVHPTDGTITAVGNTDGALPGHNNTGNAGPNGAVQNYDLHTIQ